MIQQLGDVDFDILLFLVDIVLQQFQTLFKFDSLSLGVRQKVVLVELLVQVPTEGLDVTSHQALAVYYRYYRRIWLQELVVIPNVKWHQLSEKFLIKFLLMKEKFCKNEIQLINDLIFDLFTNFINDSAAAVNT